MTGTVCAPRILVLFGNIPLHGQERGNIEALDALRSTGCEVLFLIRGDWTRDTVQAELDRRGLCWVVAPYYPAIRRGVGLRIWFRNLYGILGGSWQLLRLIRSFRATHIHAGSVASILNFLPGLTMTRRPLIYRCGDVPVEHHVLWRWVWRYTCRRAAFFVANCGFLRSIIVGGGVASEKTKVIYNRPPEHRPGTGPPPVPPDPACTTFVYIGQLSADKGVGELAQAAIVHCGRYPRARFFLVGDYQWRNPFAQGLLENVRQHGLSDRIRFTGYLEDVYGVLSAADVHVCPSLADEGLPNVVLEAKSVGVPSVVFASGGLPELIEDGVDGRVCPEKTAEALADALGAYETDPSLARRQGKAAIQSLTRLGVDAFAERWRGVFDMAR